MSGLTGRVRTAQGWPVPNAVLTVTDKSGRQLARREADETGSVRTDPLPAGAGKCSEPPEKAYFEEYVRPRLTDADHVFGL
ncbi:carboxypeptidase-like regulatory domain-containing protein, partial [Nocardia sp. NPDC003648]